VNSGDIKRDAPIAARARQAGRARNAATHATFAAVGSVQGDRRDALGAAALLLLLLIGCAGVPTVVDLPTGGIYRDQELGGEWPVVVLGTPFPGVPPEQLTQIVVAAMPQGGLPQNARFVPAPPGAAPPRRVVWAFGGALAGGDGSAICQSTGGGGPQVGYIRVYGAVCRGPSALSAVQGDVDGVKSPDDPGFRRLIHDATLELFNPQPEQQRDRLGRPFGFLR
jgi:hypothetical protein